MIVGVDSERKKFFKKMARVIGITGFISAPAIILAGYLIYVLRNWLALSFNIVIPDSIYLILLFIASISAMWLTAGPPFKGSVSLEIILVK